MMHFINVLVCFGEAVFLLIWGWIVAIKSTAAEGTGLYYVTWGWDILGSIFVLIALVFFWVYYGRVKKYFHT